MTAVLRGALWMSGAILSFSTMAVAGRAISLDLDTFEIMLYRSLIGLMIVVIIGTASGRIVDIRTDRLGLHVLRNLCHFTGQNLWFYGLTVVPLAQLFALEFTAPLWAILLSALILGEPITLRRAIAALIGFVGILIVARPGVAAIGLPQMVPLMAAIGFAGSAVFTRLLTRNERITSILFWLTLMQAVFGLICAGLDGDIARPAATSLPWICVIAAAGLLAHFCLTTALSLAPAAVVMPIDFLRLPLIAVIGVLFYAEPLDPFVLLGAVVIFGSNLLNLRRGGRS